MKILIIGSKGFIGSHLVAYFTEKKNVSVWECDVVVDYVTPQYIQLDATNADYHSLFEGQQFDICINCSGAASVPDSIIQPLRDFNLNTVNVFKLLDAILKYNKSCKFINLSSAAVYGNPQENPIKETAILQPISPYGKHKQMAEMICKEFYLQFSIAACSLRIFSAYGNGLKKQLFWDLYQKSKSPEEICLFGTGNETRDFIHVSDITRVIDLVIQKADFEGEAINVANGNEVSIKNAVNIFFKNISPKLSFSFSNYVRKGDPDNWCADISVIKSFGYTPLVSLEEGLKRYYIWAKENS